MSQERLDLICFMLDVVFNGKPRTTNYIACVYCKYRVEQFPNMETIRRFRDLGLCPKCLEVLDGP